jgi:hypothetical protein
MGQGLGHSSAQQTSKVYADYQPEILRAKASALDMAPLISAELCHVSNLEATKISAIAVTLTITQASKTADQGTDPKFAPFLKSNEDDCPREPHHRFLDSSSS